MNNIKKEIGTRDSGQLGESIRTVLVVGLGFRTGLAASNFLSSKGISVTVTDMKKEEELADIISNLDKDVSVIAGNQDPSILDGGYDLVVLSPGVPQSISLIVEAKKRNIPVISEVELAYIYLKGKMIAITGTDGKSTTTTLTGYVLERLGINTLVGGNIGIPLISLVEKSTEESVSVVELSSFQLETIDTFRPDVAAILNISPDHLDRYNGMDDYLEAKLNIAMNQTGDDFFIVNMDDRYLFEACRKISAKMKTFSLTDSGADCHYDGKWILLRNGEEAIEILEPEKMTVVGVHNIQNAMSAILLVDSVYKKIGSAPDYDIIAEAICSFKGLEHRMESIGEVEGRKFINDSKATTIGAVEMAVKGFSKDCVLIIGGRTKGDDYTRLVNTLKERVKGLILIGESREEFTRLFKDIRHESAETLDEAVIKGMAMTGEGDTILLSPACASFDMFSNYEERGTAFKESYQKLQRGELSWI